MLLARDRDQLVERELVEHQLAYLMIPLRQKIMAISSKIGNHFGDRKVPGSRPGPADPVCMQIADLEKAKGKCPGGEALPEPLSILVKW